jgi:hypothetical protein
MGGLQPPAALVLVEKLEREGPLDHGDHHPAGPGLNGPVHHQQVAVEDAGIAHRLAAHPQEEGAAGVADQHIVEVDAALDVVVGGAGEARRHAGAHQGQGLAAGRPQRIGLAHQGRLQCRLQFAAGHELQADALPHAASAVQHHHPSPDLLAVCLY